MTARFVALWPQPDEDVEGFEEHYRSTHAPIAETWPDVRSIRVTRAAGNPVGGDPAYHLVFVAQWDSEDDMQAALRSEQMQEAMSDVRTIGERWGIAPEVLIGSDL